jgi:hypothetical protein
MSQFARLTRDVQALRVKLLGHPLYGMIDSLTNLRIFMEYHVFAVWDFMSLLKSLQRSQTSVEIPWCPRPNPTTTRFINEIVLCEESDEDGAGGYTSHFELYRSAMKECGASTAKIDDLVEQVGKGVDISQAWSRRQRGGVRQKHLVVYQVGSPASSSSSVHTRAGGRASRDFPQLRCIAGERAGNRFAEAEVLPGATHRVG